MSEIELTKQVADEPGEDVADEATPAETAGVATAAPEAVEVTAAEPEAAETTATEPEAAETTTARLMGWAAAKRRAVAVGVAAAAVLGAAIGSSVFFFVQGQHKQALLDAHESARTAACEYAPVLATYDAKNLDTYFAGVLEGATGDWRKQFDSTSKDLREVLTAGQVTSASTDVQCAIRTGDQDSAEAIVVIGQTITSLGTQNKPQPGQLSMVMRLERQGDRWLVNKVNSPLLSQARP
ncbi:hypothetical protein [Nocardia inohanensis]|uniref:hypothetical protein n=1 Tax=Nocardia inohanensis TaxID=209246 RepID=UPI00082B5988|nr:hypothetical protein [Nocardia inohanensis]